VNPKRRPFVCGNWKMFHGGASGVTLAGAVVREVASLAKVDVAIAPPFTVLAACAHECEGSRVAICAQNIHVKREGAFTGEVSGPMLIESGASWVIVGHSERRQYFAESDQVVAEKVEAAISCGLHPIACVGETLAEREGGKTLEVVKRQVSALLPVLWSHASVATAIAYEPVWAIGTGKNAGPAEAEEVHQAIRGWLGAVGERVRILYGGSVKADNAAALLAAPNVDGALVGGASLDAGSFGAIARAADALAAKG